MSAQEQNRRFFVADVEIQTDKQKVFGCYTKIDGEKFYKIAQYDKMPPFFMSIVSADDHWMFISSTGALTAGRVNRDNALFPYYTVDKIHDSSHNTGSKSLFFVERDSKQFLWEVFSDRYAGLYDIERNLYKNVPGNSIIFEEINHDLGLSFRYAWSSSEQFGFVRRVSIKNLMSSPVQINMLDGIQNILPYGADFFLQNNLSNLLDAYKKNELLQPEGIGIYYLNSIPTDKAEPAEGLKASIAWSVGIEKPNILLSNRQVEKFRQTGIIETETDIRARRGAYFLQSNYVLNASESRHWYIVAEVNCDLSDLAKIRRLMTKENEAEKQVLANVKAGTQKLRSFVASADGIQLSTDSMSTSRHFSNVLFNIMRGGLISTPKGVDISDFKAHLKRSNKVLFNDKQDFLNYLPDYLPYTELLERAEKESNPDLIRLCREYLPLIFSRRHGDPSRPWNLFSINLKNEDGSQRYYYEGNWRDIFQNWEALGMSFPVYLESMIARFVNASTVDGYNPYRISSNGIDWEVIEPENPWSNIGYWGDHQIVYLHKLLELSMKYQPENLQKLMCREIFAFADLPYNIKSYFEICRNTHDTIIFDEDKDKKLRSRYRKIGSDGVLSVSPNEQVYSVNLTEKLLLTALTKLSNFVPEAGIWLNTQRPEWNDANNALVGNGVSMVTLYHLRPFLRLLNKLLKGVNTDKVLISLELNRFFQKIQSVFKKYSHLINDTISNQNRKKMVDALGYAGSEYRADVYKGFSGTKTEVPINEITGFIDSVQHFIHHSINAAKRPDKLFHSYNLIEFDFENNSLQVHNLYEMLEGQAAVLSSGYLTVEERIELLDALKNSNMYRSDQYSYTLYPDKELPRFTDKNIIPKDFSEKSTLLERLIHERNTVLFVRDIENNYHFNGEIRNAQDLTQRLDSLSKTGYAELINNERSRILNLWETMFNHHAFTGRSGTFFAYEGLGSIYWHMVSKLLQAVGQSYYWAVAQNSDTAQLGKLVEYYYEIRAGIGINKSPDLYGAFPSDPYSHTPAHAGAQQPGMTGQVKEDIISRFLELGVMVKDACLSFNPKLLRRSEFLKEERSFKYFSFSGKEEIIQVPAGALAFTYCGVPIIYHLSENEYMEIHKSGEDEQMQIDGLVLNPNLSRFVFQRENEIKKIEVFLNPGLE